MSTQVLNILQGFRNLNGITIGERKKELSLLLRENEGPIQTSANVDYLIKHLEPKTYLEQKLFVLILLHFKRDEELLTLLLGGDEKLIRPLWKQIWFFEKLLKKTSIQSFSEEFCPHLSYVSRIRFLKNVIYYTRDEKKIDQLYDVVFNKYGQSNAQHIFAGCSLEKKIVILKSCHVKLSNKHLIFLHKHKREHLQKLVELKKDFPILDFYDYHSKAFKYIAGHDDNILTENFMDNNCSSIGKRLTRKILKQELPYVLQNASNIHQKLHQRSLLKSLKSNFEQFFLATWPSSFKSFRLYSCYCLMKFYPRSKYVELIQQGLQKNYNTSLSENPNLIDETLLEVTKNIQIRESLLELKIRESKDEYTLPKYYGIEKSIPILKKKISAADGVRTRDNLIAALVQTCKINEDVNALLQVQEYFYFRHKNDDDTIRSTFLHEIETCFDLTSLTDQHWKLILELVKWHNIKGGNYSAGDLYMLHLKYLYKNNATQEVLNKLLVDNNYLSEIFRSFRSSWTLIDDVPKLQKFFLEMFMKSLPTSSYEEDQKISTYFKIFKVILVWNKNNPSESINYCLSQDIRESVKTMLEKPFNSYCMEKDHLILFIKGKIPCEDKQFLLEIENIFWEKLSDKFNTNAIEYYLRNKPLSIVERFDAFMSSMKASYLCDSLTLWRLVKHYDHLGLVKRAVEYLTVTSAYHMFGPIGIGLATLIHSDEYIKYLVVNKTVMLDVDDKVQVEHHKLAIKFLENAKYNDSPTILPYIVQYCQGDSLQDALAPLYYYFQHSPEKNLSQHLQVLSDRAVSVRKHAIKLACAVSPVETVYTLIKQMTEAEKNQSVLEHMYWKTFKYFLVETSEKFWFLIKLQLKSLDIAESNAFKESCNLKKIPKPFRQSYLDFVWELLDEHEKKGVDVADFKESLIRSLSPEMFKELSYEFCSNFIREKFLMFGCGNASTINAFVLDCLKHCLQKELLLSEVFDVIKKFNSNYILHQELKISYKSRSYLDSFVSNFFYSYKDFDITTISAFYNNWRKIFTATEDIENYIKLTMLVELNAVDDLNAYVSKIAEIFKKLISEFGILGMIDCFKDAICYILPDKAFNTEDSNEKLFKLALKLTESEDSQLNLLAIKLLPSEIPESNVCKSSQKKFIEILGKSKDKSVLINLNLYVCSLY